MSVKSIKVCLAVKIGLGACRVWALQNSTEERRNDSTKLNPQIMDFTVLGARRDGQCARLDSVFAHEVCSEGSSRRIADGTETLWHLHDCCEPARRRYTYGS